MENNEKILPLKHWDAEEYIVLNPVHKAQRFDWPQNQYVCWVEGALKIYQGEVERDYQWTNEDIIGSWRSIK